MLNSTQWPQIPDSVQIGNFTVFQKPAENQQVQEAIFTNMNKSNSEIIVVRLSVTPSGATNDEPPTTAKIFIVPETTTSFTSWEVFLLKIKENYFEIEFHLNSRMKLELIHKNFQLFILS